MAPVQRRRRKYAPRLPPDQRRAQLLDVALELLDGCHLHELSMQAVAKAAGVGKPVAYTVFASREELVTALLRRERERAMTQIRDAIPVDFSVHRPADAYAAVVSAFLQAVLERPTSWRLILTVPESAPREYRDSLRSARSAILGQAEFLARAGSAIQPRLAGLDPALLAHTMLSFAEMLGRLALNDPDKYPRERLEEFANAALGLLAADGFAQTGDRSS